MHRTRRQLVPVFLLFTLVGVQMPAQAQFGDLGKSLKQKVEQRIERKTDKAMEDGLDKVECAATDTECFEQAKAEGKEVTTVDGPAQAKAGQPAPLKPGQGVWANYDFKPGDRILFADDFSKDEVGDFPRRFEFKSGQIEIVEWNEGRWLRAAQGKLWIPLPETLPERYTVEFDLTGNGNAMLLTFDGKNESEPSATIEFGSTSVAFAAAKSTPTANSAPASRPRSRRYTSPSRWTASTSRRTRTRSAYSTRRTPISAAATRSSST